MAENYITLSREALSKLCGLIRESHSVAEAIDDENISSTSTYSSVKLEEMLGDTGVQVQELTSEEYQALSEEEQKNGTIYFVTDVNEIYKNGILYGSGGDSSEIDQSDLIVTCEYEVDSDDNWTVSNVSETFENIQNAAISGQDVILKAYPVGVTTNPYILQMVMYLEGTGIAFGMMLPGGDNILGLTIMITSDNSVSATRSEYDFGETATRLDAVEAAVDVLNGTGEGSVTKTVSDQIAQLVADAPDDLNTLKEMSDWITNHSDDAAAMNSAIMQNEADINVNTQAIAAINNADSGILVQAKTYADSVGASATAHADSGDAETLAAANTYADTQSTAALNNAKAYADSKLITGSDAASLTNCPEGCWYGQYE